VDIYNASSSSDRSGNPLLTPAQIASRGDGLRIFYYVLYGLVLSFAFGVIPFSYFYYEEFDEEVTIKQRIWAGCKYTIFLLVIITILMVVGLILYFVKPGDKPTSGENAKQWVTALAAKENIGEAAIGFAISVLTLIGYLSWLTYTAYGLSTLPIGFIRGRKHAVEESSEIINNLDKTRGETTSIKSKYLAGNKKISKKDEARVSLLKRKERALSRQHERLQGTQTCFRHVWTIMKPFMFIFGFFFFLVSLLIVISIVLTNADKAINATHFCGSQCGFVLAYPKIFNPVDSLLTILSKYFPIDYVVIALLILYIFFATLSGIANIGLRFLWVHLYDVRPGGTPPQGMLLTTMVLMLSLLALNMEVTTLAPQYASFGSQVYRNGTTIEPCSLFSPPGNCTLTQIATIIDRINIRTSFFGIIFYYITWLFVAAFLIGSIVACVRSRKSNIEKRESDSDEDES